MASPKRLKQPTLLGDLCVKCQGKDDADLEAVMLQFLQRHADALEIPERHHARAARALAKAVKRYREPRQPPAQLLQAIPAFPAPVRH